MVHQPSNPFRILLLGDYSAETRLVTDCLQSAAADHEIFTAAHLVEGLEIIREEQFDLILLDLSLPESKGSATVKLVRSLAGNAALIALVGPGDEVLAHAALQAGAEDCLGTEGLSTELLNRAIKYSIGQRRLKAKIEEQETMLHSIFEAQTDAMLLLNQEYEIVRFNSAAASLLGAEGVSLIGETFPFEISASESPEVEIPEVNGGSRIVQFKASPLTREGAQAKLIIMRDITQRRHFENALKVEQQRLAITLDSITDAVFACNSSGTVDLINAEASRLTGLSSTEATGQALSNVLHLENPNTGERIVTPNEESLKALGQERLILIHAKDKTAHDVSIEIQPILNKEGTQHGSITVLKEIRDQLSAEDPRLIEEKFNSISLLAAGIAHDFNNMLSAILGNISLILVDLPKEDPSADKLLAAETAALQAKSLTQQLLSFSKGGITSLETTTIQQVVEESAQFILRGSNVKCKVEKDEALWPVDADKGQISQVVHNLIINADQAMPSGGTIHLSMNNCQLKQGDVPELEAGDYVCIEFADQGIGISPENLKRVFIPYFTTKSDGNGLGLASSHAIIKNHHGAIMVESEVNKGTCFRLYLPRANKSAAPPQPTPPEETQAPEPVHQGSGRILVMDDMEAMMMVAGEILNVLGYEVEYTANGEQAIEAYKKAKESGKPFDAVVFDLTVPGAMGGEDASNILIQYDPALVAIASSGYTTSNIMSDYKNSAFKAVVPKPYRIKEMSDALNRALNKPEA
ncbi:MAG: response regulator [Opitutales bacterium]